MVAVQATPAVGGGLFGVKRVLRRPEAPALGAVRENVDGVAVKMGRRAAARRAQIKLGLVP